ncbi:hypothetical protein EDD28_1455 [Salana multivorans]|uniref:Secreted protein n=1 Tax=Salana multivorans TaxID=120377 RepID=A0A3N2DAU0_9MICO|nr:hypothetical protein [Salana multivorans]MBN8882148.1 hypothetical protein [Salana multivorans]OJX97007.1 MAG: hypothetical protein BGO96_02830 [Micrococcales bacterium 73-15]ROR96863.1 hypothetical protein EDD28_1455 [Salana multivorans]
MNTKRLLSSVAGLALVAGGAFGLAACGGDSNGGTTGGDGGSSEDAPAASESDIAEDLQNARQAVLDALAEDDSWSQIMLASDVKAPTVKYGLLVVPYSFSEAASRIQSTVDIKDGKFTIDGDSAATGQTWVIDQDGNITEKAS